MKIIYQCRISEVIQCTLLQISAMLFLHFSSDFRREIPVLTNAESFRFFNICPTLLVDTLMQSFILVKLY
jgi:hypothetical protein